MSGRIIPLNEAPIGDRLVVFGGRTYGTIVEGESEEQRRERIPREINRLYEVLDILRPREIAHGTAPGADTFAELWAESRGVPFMRFAPLRDHGGSKYQRNRDMYASFEPDGGVSFRGGRGTADMELVVLDGGSYLVRIR